MSKRVPDWLLERFALGELPPERMEATRKQLEAEPGGAERLAVLRASNEEILEAYPVRWFVGAVNNRLRGARQTRGWMLAVPVLVATAALFVAVLPTEPTTTGPDDGGEIIYAKGDRALQIFRKDGEHTTAVGAGDLVGAGDRLQVRYVASGAKFGAVYSIDGNGVMTRHLPVRGGEAVALDPAGAVSLENSYELDDAPDYERFFFITGEEPFDLTSVQAAVERLAADPRAARHADLSLNDALDQWSLTLNKEER